LEHNLLLRALILMSLILFGFYLLGDQGFLTLTLDSDRSHISYVILGLYGILSLHWFYLVLQLSSEQKHLDEIYPMLEAIGEGGLTKRDECLCINDRELQHSMFSEYLDNLLTKSRQSSTSDLEHGILLEALSERLISKYAFGHYASDVLLKLGLLGTIIGFIMMLAPVGELTDFDPNVLQQLLGKMSGGMAVALFTTISGLVTSTLLALQYQLLDSAAVRFVDKVAVSVDVLVIPILSRRTHLSADLV
jgi:hypothetical protein